MLKHIQQEASFYRVMLGAQANSLLEQRFCQKTEKRFISYFNQAFPERISEPDAPPLDLKDHLIAAVGRGAIIWWLDQEQPSTPEQFALWLQQLISGILVQYPQSGAKNASVSARARLAYRDECPLYWRD